MASETRNPWLSYAPSENNDVSTAPAVAPANAFEGGAQLRPQPGAVMPPLHGLPVAPAPEGPRAGWAWLGCHGGAGVTSLEQAVPGGWDAGRRWPAAAGGRQPVVLVCRSHASGLTAAQNAARQWASGSVPGVELLGLVVMADVPGSLPRPLKHLLHLVRGGLPRTWLVPWVDAWRLGEPPASHLPRQLISLARDLGPYTRTGNQHV